MGALEYGRRAAKSGNTKNLVVFLHGYGANGADLLGLADPLGEHLPDTVFLAPDAPEPCTGNPMGFQWFPIPWLDGSSEEMARDSMRVSVDALNIWLDKMIDKEGVTPAQTILFGFSQGTMMSLELGPARDIAFAGIVGFSGRLLDPGALKSAQSKPPVLLVHGDQDPMVPHASMQEAAEALAAAGVTVRTHTSPGTGHGIAPDGLNMALRFITDVLPG